MTILGSKRESIQIKSVSIKNYRGFFGEQPIFLGQFDGKENGSGLTIITGANNSGKTSILESITVYPTKYAGAFLPDEHQENNITNITVETTNEIYAYRYKINENEEQTYKWEEINNKELKYDPPIIIATQRLSLDDHDQLRSEKGITEEFLQQLREIEWGDEAIKNCFYQLVREIIPNFGNLVIPEDKITKGVSIKYSTVEGKDHSIDFLGMGVISVLRICAYLLFHPSTILVIDEPELSLHPLAQKNLREILSKYSKDRQIIVVTHSPYFIDWADFINRASFVSTKKIDKGCCTIHHLKITDEKKLKKIRSSWRSPYTLDLVMKEIFFSNKILLVEGKEDAGLIKKWLRNEYKKNSQYTPSFEICGYGTDGVGNITMFLDMAKSLGINKVGVLTDKLSEKDIKLFEDWEESNKKHGYQFQQLITNDIRIKIKIKVEELIKNCIDTQTGKLIKSSNIIEDIEKCIEITDNGYFSPEGDLYKCSNCASQEQVDSETKISGTNGNKEMVKCDEECKSNSLIRIFEKFDGHFENED